jgi:uncharacterized membrane protein YedE/YeeE
MAMKGNLFAFASGLIFAVGLGVSGMTSQDKVIGFLDISGAWDPSLAFVMIGAIAVHFVAGRIVRTRKSPLFDTKFHLPTSQDLDAKLLAGAALFGVGWGLGGFCPGPGIVSAVKGGAAPVVFVVTMTLGMILQHFVFAPRTKSAPVQAAR